MKNSSQNEPLQNEKFDKEIEQFIKKKKEENAAFKKLLIELEKKLQKSK
ncbi:MAG: hypothetical protein K8R58_10380 [Bacteroidales bacterium]|nr:hypothetical protein [Bacteroidales bacterium]